MLIIFSTLRILDIYCQIFGAFNVFKNTFQMTNNPLSVKELQKNLIRNRAANKQK